MAGGGEGDVDRSEGGLSVVLECKYPDVLRCSHPPKLGFGSLNFERVVRRFSGVAVD